MSEYELVNALAGLSGNIDTRKSGQKGSDPIFPTPYFLILQCNIIK